AFAGTTSSRSGLVVAALNPVSNQLLPANVVAIIAGDCLTCHGSYFTNHKNVNHVTLVGDAAACAGCHPGTKGSATTVPVSQGDNKVHDTCSTCHEINGDLRAAYGRAQAMPNGGDGGNNGGGTCDACHTLGFVGSHPGSDHSIKVSAYANCVTCHTAVGATVDPADPKVHDSCNACHDAVTGVLIGSATGNSGGGNCSVCHGEYFVSHTHAHTVLQAATDKAQATPGSLCSACHIPSPSGLTTWASVYAEHLGDCGTCHSSARQDVKNAITAKANPTDCLVCHATKQTPATHGGHSVSHFANHASCSGCHNDGGLGVVVGIHKNSCTMCHTSASGGTGTAKVGANGDGNAILGIGAAPYTGVTCLTCHNVADPDVTPASIGGIHHNNTGS
ncbi:MAG: hypothetical protein Q8J76_02395, partial [Desulfobulbaceae bacterium]|nr:hypothetical protein [Desulfobulbaceae bacterium]